MKIFITGGTGFIGTHLVRKLQEERHDLLLLTRNSKKLFYNNSLGKVTVVTGNLSNISFWKDELKKFQPDIAIHMAWEGIPNYDSEISIKNLVHGLNLFKLLVDIKCPRVICTGSCWEYGLQQGILHEDFAVKPLNAFSASKNALHWLGADLAKENDTQFVWTRLFYVYGNGQRDFSLIPYLIKCVLEGKKPEIKTPSAKKDFVYVEDVADAIVAILKNCKQSTVYNIGSGRSTSVKEIVNVVYDNLRIKNEFELESTSRDYAPCDDYWADISKIKMEIGWEPKIKLLEGIRETIQAMRYNNW